MESKPPAKRFAYEFLAATAVFALCLCWIFRTPLRKGQVAAFQTPPPSASALMNLGDMAYELECVLFAQTRIIKQGFFPSWSPYSGAGTPLIGKMQNGVFAPEHLLLYVFPMAAIPYLLMLVMAWKTYLAFIFTYLYARSLRVDLFGGIFAGVIYVFSEVISGGLFAWNSVAAYLPLLLLLVECYFRGHRRRAQWLLPWAVAFTFFAGHFESAFYVNLVAGIYFLGRLASEGPPTWREKSRRFLGFVLPASVGAVLAGV